MRTGRVAFTVLSAWLAAVLLVPAPADGQAAVASVKAGNRAVAAGNPGAAVEAYRRALSLDPHSAVARFNLGTALAAWLAAVLAVPAPAEGQAAVATVKAGNRALAAGNPGAAVEAYRRALAIDPRSAMARFNLGTALAAAGQWDAAVEALSLAVEAF
nr:tetratricopeptide repeat protein [Vicinamibacterales bacterium]